MANQSKQLRRSRPLNIERINETRAIASHLSRADFQLASKFRRYMIRWAGIDELRWKALCILCLREVNGWTMEMIGLVFGHPKGHVTRIVTDTKLELATKFLNTWLNHRTDSYAAIRMVNAETLLDRMTKLRHLMRTDDADADAAIDDLRQQLAKWHDTN